MVTGDSDYTTISSILTPNEICRLQQQAVLLVQAYNIAKEDMIDRKSSWEQCCKKSVQMANLVGKVACGASEALRRWHHSFVTSHEGFHHPTAGIGSGIGY
jgi:hypothetical protein